MTAIPEIPEAPDRDVDAEPLFLTVEETIAELGITEHELRQLRFNKAGPLFTRLGARTIRYWRVSVLEYKNKTKLAATG